MARHGAKPRRAFACMHQEYRIKQAIDRRMKKEIEDPELGLEVYLSCLERWGHRGMYWVDHCVKADINYRQIHGR